jgi:hypothetical protein
MRHAEWRFTASQRIMRAVGIACEAKIAPELMLPRNFPR